MASCSITFTTVGAQASKLSTKNRAAVQSTICRSYSYLLSQQPTSQRLEQQQSSQAQQQVRCFHTPLRWSSQSSAGTKTASPGQNNQPKNESIMGRNISIGKMRNFEGTSSSGSLQQRRPFSSANKRDFYDVLGVPRGSDKGAIKKAYFQLAKKYHPDQNQGDANAADKFKEATEAYEVLSDDKQRELYDNFGHAGVDPNSGFSSGGGGMGGQNPFGGGFEGFNFGDGSFHFSSSGGPGGANEIDAEELFEAFFGGGGRRRPRGPRRGADLQMHVRLSFKEAVFGASKDLHLRYQLRDPQTGKIEVKEREVTVDTPPGIDNGMNLRLQGQGAEGDPGAPRGNLLVQVIVDDDDYFHRDGSDVHTEVSISFVQAILGGTVDVKTLTGMVEMNIPKGTQPDKKLLMRGKGIQRLHGSAKGNQIVHLKIEIPTKITARQEELLREFDEETKNSGGGGIWGGLAKAAGSAFETFFGGKKNKEKDGDETKNSAEDSKVGEEVTEKKEDEKTVNDTKKDEESDDEMEEKKQQAS